MKRRKDKQAIRKLDPLDVWVKARRNGWKRQGPLARRLNRSQAAISRAFKGELPLVLARINKLVSKPKGTAA